MLAVCVMIRRWRTDRDGTKLPLPNHQWLHSTRKPRSSGLDRSTGLLQLLIYQCSLPFLHRDLNDLFNWNKQRFFLELQRRIQAMEMRCYRKILCICYKDRAKVQQATGPREDFLTIVKRCKLQWYGHVSCSSGLAKTILQGSVKGGKRQDRGRGGKTTSGNGKAEGSGEQGKMEEIGCKIICKAPTTLAIKG